SDGSSLQPPIQFLHQGSGIPVPSQRIVMGGLGHYPAKVAAYSRRIRVPALSTSQHFLEQKSELVDVGGRCDGTPIPLLRRRVARSHHVDTRVRSVMVGQRVSDGYELRDAEFQKLG